jgi:hypothetical protein
MAERQARNWRNRATIAYVGFRKGNNLRKGQIPSSELKPKDDALLKDLEESKLYFDYVRNTTDPQLVYIWRNAKVDDNQP